MIISTRPSCWTLPVINPALVRPDPVNYASWALLPRTEKILNVDEGIPRVLRTAYKVIVFCVHLIGVVHQMAVEAVGVVMFRKLVMLVLLASSGYVCFLVWQKLTPDEKAVVTRKAEQVVDKAKVLANHAADKLTGVAKERIKKLDEVSLDEQEQTDQTQDVRTAEAY